MLLSDFEKLVTVYSVFTHCFLICSPMPSVLFHSLPAYLTTHLMRGHHTYTPLYINGAPVERVSCFKYLGVTISADLTWSNHIQTTARKANQRLYHLRQLRKFWASPAIPRSFHSATVENILTQSMASWYENSCEQEHKALQRITRAAERGCRTTPPSLPDLHNKRCLRKAARIIRDASHPRYILFKPLKSGRPLF